MEYVDENTQRQTLWFGFAVFERSRMERGKSTIAEDWLHFSDADTFFNWVEGRTRERSTTYIYAHNLQYDAALLSLSTMAAKYACVVAEYVPDPHLLWITMRKGNRTLQFIDSLNYFNTSLAKLGESIGLSKMTAEVHPQPVSWWEEYCKRDVEVLRAAMHSYFDFLTTNELGAYRKTAAAQAYGAFRHRFMHHKILIIADPVVEQLERKAYHGGRSEVFYDVPLHHRVYCLDINSMYPAVMRDNNFPYRKVVSGHYLNPVGAASFIGKRAVVAHVTIETDEPCYPKDTGERVIYPVGRFDTVLSTPELLYALGKGHVAGIGEYVLYEQAPLFKDYVETLYSLRLLYKEQNNEAFQYMCKLFLNSLYGKFGQRGQRWELCSYSAPPGISEWHGACGQDNEIMKHRTRFDEVWHKRLDGEAFESFPAIAAHVTSYARMKLWQLINTAGREHVYYVDTDSLYVDDSGYANLSHLIDSAQLGLLKVEAAYEWAHFRAPKDYAHSAGERVKGVRARAVKLASNRYKQEVFESYDQALQRGVDGEIIVKWITKTLSRRNYQSTGEGLGWRQPIRLGE